MGSSQNTGILGSNPDAAPTVIDDIKRDNVSRKELKGRQGEALINPLDFICFAAMTRVTASRVRKRRFSFLKKNSAISWSS